MPKYSLKIKLLFFMTFIFALLSILWMMSINNSFTFDDFSTLNIARFKSFDELFHFLPTQKYNDRPIGIIFIKMLNMLFGLNPQNYHIVFGIIHFINIYLVFKISYILFDRNEKINDNSIYYSILAAAIFGIYPISLMSVSWLSAVFDLLCTLFLLLCMYYYLKSSIYQNYDHFYGLLSIIFYYIAIRTKEMALTLPLIFLIYEIGKALKNKKRIKLRWFIIFELLMMAFFVFLLFMKDGIENISPDNPYYQSFNIVNLFKNAIRYLFLYFDWGNMGFSFVAYSINSIVGVLLFAFILLFSLFLIIKKKDYSVLLSIIAIGISISVVLTMVNMQHRLYLYFPSVLIGIAVALFLYKFADTIRFKYLWELILIIIPCLYLINLTPGTISYKESWLNYCKQDSIALNQLEKLQKPINSANIYVKGALDSYNIFYYGPGNSIKLLYDDPTINTILVDEFPLEPETPYVFLEYDYTNNIITEIHRDMALKVLKITSVFPEQIDENTIFNEDGSLNIGVVCNEINENLIIAINGVELSTTIGADFISASIPKEFLNQKVVEVEVKNTSLNTVTEKYQIQIIN